MTATGCSGFMRDGPEPYRRIKTEEKAKDVAVVWGTYVNAALAI